MSIIGRFFPHFQRASIDEAYVDVTDAVMEEMVSLGLWDEKEDRDLWTPDMKVKWDGVGVLVGEQVLESSSFRFVMNLF
jgi:hypothetical protein